LDHLTALDECLWKAKPPLEAMSVEKQTQFMSLLEEAKNMQGFDINMTVSVCFLKCVV
jgi:hypothetical protein